MSTPPRRGLITPHFSVLEMACKCCGHFIPERMQVLCTRLEHVREMYGPLLIVSGHRCPTQNKRVRGHKGSFHLESLAADIRCTRDSDRFRLVALLHTLGFTGIGVGRELVHGDLRVTLLHDLKPMLWTYPLPDIEVDQ